MLVITRKLGQIVNVGCGSIKLLHILTRCHGAFEQTVAILQLDAPAIPRKRRLIELVLEEAFSFPAGGSRQTFVKIAEFQLLTGDAPQVRIAFDAPRDVIILRRELVDRPRTAAAAAAAAAALGGMP